MKLFSGFRGCFSRLLNKEEAVSLPPYYFAFAFTYFTGTSICCAVSSTVMPLFKNRLHTSFMFSPTISRAFPDCLCSWGFRAEKTSSPSTIAGLISMRRTYWWAWSYMPGSWACGARKDDGRRALASGKHKAAEGRKRLEGRFLLRFCQAGGQTKKSEGK